MGVRGEGVVIVMERDGRGLKGGRQWMDGYFSSQNIFLNPHTP